MNKYKLIQLIVKDLEELKTLTAEVAVSEGESPLAIDLALSRAKLLCQEIELLKELSIQTTPVKTIQNETPEEAVEEEVSDESYADPELEIIHFEEHSPIAEDEFQEPEPEIEEDEEEEEEEVVYDSDEDELEEETEGTDDKEEVTERETIEQTTEPEEEVQDEEIAKEELEEEPAEDEHIEEDESAEEKKEELEDEEVLEVEESEPEFEVESETEEEKEEVTTHKLESSATFREIHIEDLDEDDDEPIQFTPISKPVEKPVIHEIPKPEEAPKENPVIGETFQKERSLNDVMGEKQAQETSLGNGPISSLRSAIGLNDRFLFIREIFGNNTDKYNMIIDHLDKLETIQQAVEYLKANLTLQKNDTSMKFVDLLKRRFTK
ncbi:MAG: hypothetical protein JNK09_05460 [Prolixibacteraceae bacterium]|nr:hypothetical protein [Prolixibacteraceae bacterium]